MHTMEENKNQTAVEWLIELLHPTISVRLSNTYIKVLKEKAKAMEKEQIKDAYANGSNDRLKNKVKDYYNETYGN